ncbi:hypothetical protein [Bradyrhizobium sp. WSM2254]|uniref:hypothetical protein n=1 Tax=Bradyrhizobium sp. WSM2254 TaxID=1188263 RepID=UPI000419B2B1|nr:hypothetical protein [Bradyrhizobium sp. WSM2254]
MAQISAEALTLIDSITRDLSRLRGLLQPQELDVGDPKDPRNKTADGKLSERGVEVCYRMYDSGLTRYAVADGMAISYGAATHRFGAWQKAGGQGRARASID